MAPASREALFRLFFIIVCLLYLVLVRISPYSGNIVPFRLTFTALRPTYL